jgi:hypothetical protein
MRRDFFFYQKDQFILFDFDSFWALLYLVLFSFFVFALNEMKQTNK